MQLCLIPQDFKPFHRVWLAIQNMVLRLSLH